MTLYLDGYYKEEEKAKHTKMIKVVNQVKRLGTAKLLDLTKGMDEIKARALLQYIGHLEQSENRLASQIQNFYNSISQYEYDH